MTDAALHDKIDTLTDLEIAVLIPLIAQQHCIVDTAASALDDLEDELALIARNVFGLSHAVINCHARTSSADIWDGVFVGPALDDDKDAVGEKEDRHFQSFPTTPHDQKIANVVIAKNFHLTSDAVQIAVLERLLSAQIPTKDGVKSAPRTFLFLPLIGADASTSISSLFNKHLIDQFFSSYHHPPDDGFPNIEHDGQESVADDNASITSVLRHRRKPSLLGDHDITALRTTSATVHLAPEITAYIRSITVFLRMDRAVAAGITPLATRHITSFARCLAPIQRARFVSPALVDVAARKVLRHRIVVAQAGQDRSLMYGGKRRGAEMALRGVEAEGIIERVLRGVDAVV